MQDKETTTSESTWWGADEPEGTSWQTGSQEKRDRMDAYVEWLITPKAERQPSTKKELAERLGVTPQTLRNYDRERWVQQQVLERGRASAKVERALDVVDRLYHRATERTEDITPAAANTAAKIFLDWIESQATTTEEDYTNLSDEELIEKLVQVQETLNSRPRN